MNFKGKLSVDGDIGDPLPVDCEVTDTRLTIRTRDGSVIGDWRIQELTVTQTPDGVVLRVDDEKLRIAVRRPEVFAKALRATGTSDVARRISAARESSPDPDRVRPLLAVGILAGLFAVFGLGLWATGSPPFERQATSPVAVLVETTVAPPPANTAPRIMSDDEVFVAVLRASVEPRFPIVAQVSDALLLNLGYGLCEAASVGDTGGLDPSLGMTTMLIGAIDVFDNDVLGAFVVGAALATAGETICREHSRYITEMLQFASNP